MKGEYALKILEKLSETVAGAGDLFEAFLSAGYGSSASKMEYELYRAKKRRRLMDEEQKKYTHLRHRYHNILNWLKCDGLIIERRLGNKKLFNLTTRGNKKLVSLKERINNSLPKNGYSVIKNNNFVIVVFDIPEIERKKREWLRCVLKNMGFKLLQKSVWMGKVKIPKSFVDNLSRLKIAEFVEIFEITKTGSLRHII